MLRVRGGHRRKGGEQAAEVVPVFGQGTTEAAPPGRVEQGEGQVGLVDTVGGLVPIDLDRETSGLVGSMRPRWIGEMAAGGQGLGPHYEAKFQLATTHGGRYVADEAQGDRATEARVGALAGVSPQALREPGTRIVVLPGLAVDDLQALDASEGVREPGVGRCRLGCGLPHGHRFGSGLFPPGPARNTDDAWRPRVDCHVRRSGLGRGAGLPGRR